MSLYKPQRTIEDLFFFFPYVNGGSALKSIISTYAKARKKGIQEIARLLPIINKEHDMIDPGLKQVLSNFSYRGDALGIKFIYNQQMVQEYNTYLFRHITPSYKELMQAYGQILTTRSPDYAKLTKLPNISSPTTSHKQSEQKTTNKQKTKEDEVGEAFAEAILEVDLQLKSWWIEGGGTEREFENSSLAVLPKEIRSFLKIPEGNQKKDPDSQEDKIPF